MLLRRATSSQTVLAAIAIALVGAYGAFTGWALERTTYDVWGALLFLPVLLLLSYPMVAAAARREDDRWVAQTIAIAFVAKMASAFARWAMSFVLYSGVADASGYNGHGAPLAHDFRHLSFHAPDGLPLIGTGFIILVTAVVYTFTGPSIFAGYLAFSWLSFWGLYLAYRAFVTAFPQAPRRRYVALVLLTPSLLFWPSGIGKEAWIMACMGPALLGVSRLYARKRGGVALLLLGLLGIGFVRPHVGALIIAATVLGFMVRPPGPRGRTALTPVFKILGLAVLAGIAFFAAQRAASYFNLQDLSLNSINQALGEADKRTSQGGSEFHAVPATHPIGFLIAVVTVLIRPFPGEARSLQGLATSAEGLLYLVLLWRNRTVLKTLPRQLRSHPFVLFCVSYVLMFAFAFSNINNFGILARQRVQVLPVFMVLLALPIAGRVTGRRGTIRPPVRDRLGVGGDR